MSANNANVYLKKARYGKDLVRLMRVYKEGNVQHCTELTVSFLHIMKFDKGLIRLLRSIGQTFVGRWYRDLLHQGR